MTRLAIAVLIATSGCVVHLDRNAPGLTSLQIPPENPKVVEEPDDPGENVLLLSGGGYVGAGGRVGEGSGDGTSEIGVEVSLDFGRLPVSHQQSDIPFPFPPLPETRIGVNLGWTLVESSRNRFGDGEIGPLYLEGHYATRFWSLSGGYSLDPGDTTHGPQLTATGYFMYAKVSYRIDRGFDAYVGFVFKLGTAFIWSQ